MKLELNPSVAEFFRDTVRTILHDRKVHVQETTEFYVVNLLTQAVQSSQENSDPNYFDAPLAILFGKAFSTANQNEKYSLLKHLGDQSLFVSGFFGDSLKRKIIDVDYYISMGSQAYGCLSDISRKQIEKDFFSTTFDELSGKFTSFVDIFSEISERANITSNQDVLRMYERWLYTKSNSLLEKLQKMGIQPVDTNNEDLQ
jgi:hypothetical protein